MFVYAKFFGNLWKRRYGYLKIFGLILLLLSSRTRRRSWLTAKWALGYARKNQEQGDVSGYINLIRQNLRQAGLSIWSLGSSGQELFSLRHEGRRVQVEKDLELARHRCKIVDVDYLVDQVQSYLESSRLTPEEIGTSAEELRQLRCQGWEKELGRCIEAAEKALREADENDFSKVLAIDLERWQKGAEKWLGLLQYPEPVKRSVLHKFDDAHKARKKREARKLIVDAQHCLDERHDRYGARTLLVLARMAAQQGGCTDLKELGIKAEQEKVLQGF